MQTRERKKERENEEKRGGFRQAFFYGRFSPQETEGRERAISDRDTSSKMDFQQFLELTLEFNMLLQKRIICCNVTSWLTTV